MAVRNFLRLLQSSFCLSVCLSVHPSIHPQRRARAPRRLIVAIKLDLHRAVLELDAVETLDRSLRLLAGFKEHRTPALGAAGIRVAHRRGVDDVADLLEHLAKILARRRPRKVTDDNLQSTRVLRASLHARALRTRTRALHAHDDGSSLDFRVVHLRDGVGRFIRRREIDERPALGAAAVLTRHFALSHIDTKRRAVRHEHLLRGFPREVSKVAAAPFAARRRLAQDDRGVLLTSRLGRRLVLANGDRAVTQRLAYGHHKESKVKYTSVTRPDKQNKTNSGNKQ